VTLDGKTFSDDPFRVLQAELDRFALPVQPDLPPFQGGVAGYFGYELHQHLEKIKLAARDDMQFPDIVLGFYDLVLAFDLTLERAWIFSSGYPEFEKTKRKKRAAARTAWVAGLLQNVPALPPLPLFVSAQTASANFTAAVYQAAVDKVREYILAGDIFEANLTQCFKAFLPRDFTTWDLYRRLRSLNPAPFAAFVNFENVTVVSASPERFLQLRQGKVTTHPIKGTRRRGQTEMEDRLRAQELLQSEKDRAENIMIVDLMRNDLSRVCEDHSVKVTGLCELESFATVHHLVSTIEGELQTGKNAVDLLRATFPGGSITGAPKVRAMEIIADIEPTQRGPYCGSIGYIGFNGDMDCSIVIRSYTVKNNAVTFQAGGAVVADSVPLEEYEEMLTKSLALQNALSGMQEKESHDFVN
jgi:para-aminobenzoate synthetase component 1